jgi:hypothetical protein
MMENISAFAALRWLRTQDEKKRSFARINAE